MSLIFKLPIVLVIGSLWIKTLGSVVFISQPQDTTVSEGSNVRFECSFEGSTRIPDWKINMTLYYWQYVPHPFIFHLSDFSLTVENVNVSFNATTIQCIIPGEAESSVGQLTVVRRMLHTSTIPVYIPYKLTVNLHKSTSVLGPNSTIQLLDNIITDQNSSRRGSTRTKFTLKLGIAFATAIAVSSLVGVLVCILGMCVYYRRKRMKIAFDVNKVQTARNKAYETVSMKVVSNAAYEIVTCYNY